LGQRLDDRRERGRNPPVGKKKKNQLAFPQPEKGEGRKEKTIKKDRVGKFQGGNESRGERREKLVTTGREEKRTS